MRDINNSQDTLDSHDVIARRDELAEERDDLASRMDEARQDWEDPVRPLPDEAQEDQEAREATALAALKAAEEALREWDAENADELAALEAFIAEGSDEWRHGVTLIRETYFEEYAHELAEDCCELPRDLKWPFTCIDWEQAARELQYDYTGADFAGVTYYYQG